MSSLQTAFQTTRGARITNSELAWHNVYALAGASRTAVRGAFKLYPWYSLRCPQENETCRRRRARAAIKERILDLAGAAVLERASRPLSSELRRAGCLSPVS